MALLSHGLLPASFRGVPFAVQASETGGGRRIALHTYPGRDEPWAEDMGRAPRIYRFRAFIVDGDVVFAGGPIQLQRALLLAALEKSGSGTLTHPTLGILNVAVHAFSVGEDLGAGRMSSIDVEFVESGKKSFPSILSTSSGLLSAANLCTVALAVDGIRVLAAAIGAGGTRQDVSAAALGCAAQTETLGADATALYRLAAQLPGSYGRFAGGGNSGINGQSASPYTADTTITDLVGIASLARVTIATAASALTAAVASDDLTNAVDVPAAVSALVQALANACADPADAIRLLRQAATYSPGSSASAQAVAGMFQRSAAAALVTAAGAYQPTSADDAAALMDSLAELLDDLATAAADAGDDQSYAALRSARAAIVKDLRARGGTLAHIATFEFGAQLPALALAQRLYRDPTRADQLVGQVNPISPLFMPSSFQALAA